MMFNAASSTSLLRSVFLWVAGPVLATLLLVAANRLMAAVPASCAQPAAGSIVESDEFTPWESRLSHLPELPIVGEGQSSAPLPPTARFGTEVIAGLARQFTVAGNGSVYLYFLDRPLGTMSPDEFLEAGGIQLEQDPVVGDAMYPADLFEELGGRATAVKVGSFDGALVWADPHARGMRSHNLYWSDGAYNYGLIAVRSPEEVVGIARALVC